MLSYLALFVAFLFLPGWLLTRLAAPRLAGCLTGFSMSMALLIANIVLLLQFGAPLHVLTPVMGLELVLLLICFCLAVDLRRTMRRAGVHLRKERAFYVGAVSTVLCVAGYMAWAGAYTEVPADVWRHLGYIQWALQSLEDSRTSLPVHPWYYIPAWLWHLTGDDVFTFIRDFATVNTLVQALGIYVFTHQIVRRARLGRSRAAALAGLSVMLAAFSIGVNVFSYVRYYTFGPMMQNMLVYFCCALLVLEIFERRRIPPDAAAGLGILALTLYAVHDQELAFLYALLLAMSFVVIVRRCVHQRRPEAPAAAAASLRISRHTDLAVSCAVLSISAAVFLYLRHAFALKGAELPLIVRLPGSAVTGTPLHIANPAYQVFESVTAWGLFVYVLFLVRWRVFRGNLYLVAGMLIPFVTVFNPLFVDMFLRVNEAAPIYRFVYAVPLHIVAAWCLLDLVRTIARGSLARKFAALAVSVVLVSLLWPTGLPLVHNPNSRASTLAPVPPGNDYQQWRDVIEFLRTLPPARVITDPVTAYMLRGLTHHQAPGYKFHQAFVPLDRPGGYYAGFAGALVVVNERDGEASANGALAGHWPVDVLELSQYYPPSLSAELAAQPDRFESIWEHDRVRIYRVQSE